MECKLYILYNSHIHAHIIIIIIIISSHYCIASAIIFLSVIVPVSWPHHACGEGSALCECIHFLVVLDN